MILNFIFSCATVVAFAIQGPCNLRSWKEMIVCHCRALSDRKIREVIRRGAHSPREVALACHAGRTCGGCIPAVRELIAVETCPTAIDCSEQPVVAAS
jgi:bacterioferritin-associated ferredoxin